MLCYNLFFRFCLCFSQQNQHILFFFCRVKIFYQWSMHNLLYLFKSLIIVMWMIGIFIIPYGVFTLYLPINLPYLLTYFNIYYYYFIILFLFFIFQVYIEFELKYLQSIIFFVKLLFILFLFFFSWAFCVIYEWWIFKQYVTFFV